MEAAGGGPGRAVTAAALRRAARGRCVPRQPPEGALGPRAEGTRGPLTPAVGPRLGARPRTGSQREGEAR